MRKMRRRLSVLALAAALPLGLHAAGNPESGKAKAAQICAACHGPDGNKPSAPDQPILAGQHYDYLVRALTDYKIGRRTNPIMKAASRGLACSVSRTGEPGLSTARRPYLRMDGSGSGTVSAGET